MKQFRDIRAGYEKGMLTADEAVSEILYGLTAETSLPDLQEAGPELISVLREFLNDSGSFVPRTTGAVPISREQMEMARALLK
ncbi:hypothetical protein Enr10x_60160 [Gimesia panareensis]|uniref:Uncharacterized protein n=2 Tax=Gimesia panareensis TaxID=2527978 RepID=A0A517QG74_9PLAN|nr:hypothetical protein Enr10x_60160 [Gimesia panareensis]QDU53704.1 hypothetical protein Pan110_60980 [Gimesia panareensis]